MYIIYLLFILYEYIHIGVQKCIIRFVFKLHFSFFQYLINLTLIATEIIFKLYVFKNNFYNFLCLNLICSLKIINLIFFFFSFTTM